MNAPLPAPSPAERLKAESQYLRGTIAEELAAGGDEFSKEVAGLLKHHGMYPQHNRDLRAAGGKKNAPGEPSLVVRTKLPGGRLTSDQLLAELELCDEFGNGTLRITTRQGLQIHGVGKRNIREVMRRINAAGMTTLGACGDVVRNVMCCPAPHRQDPVHDQMQQMAAKLSEHFMPRTGAYGEIWLNASPNGQGTGHRDEEPLYHEAYLPRKFKMAIALPGDNCVDLLSHDLGLLAVCEDFNVVGYNVLVGGGMGATPSNDKTFRALAQPIAFAKPEQVLDIATAIVRVFRDFGNRGDRKLARLKYLIAGEGIERLKTRVEEYYGSTLTPPRPESVWRVDLHLGWHEQGDGRWFYGLNIESGRIADRGKHQLKAALRDLCRKHRPTIRLTPQQNLLLCDIAAEHRTAVEATLRRYGVALDEAVSHARRWSMACVGFPTCPWAQAESERAISGVIDALEFELRRLGLDGESFAVRMTGCSNGCARPFLGDVGLVGRPSGKYAIYLGGRLQGDRLAYIYRDAVPLDALIPTLVPVLKRFAEERQPDERLGDFCWRTRESA